LEGDFVRHQASGLRTAKIGTEPAGSRTPIGQQKSGVPPEFQLLTGSVLASVVEILSQFFQFNSANQQKTKFFSFFCMTV